MTRVGRLLLTAACALATGCDGYLVVSLSRGSMAVDARLDGTYSAEGDLEITVTSEDEATTLALEAIRVQLQSGAELGSLAITAPEGDWPIEIGAGETVTRTIHFTGAGSSAVDPCGEASASVTVTLIGPSRDLSAYGYYAAPVDLPEGVGALEVFSNIQEHVTCESCPSGGVPSEVGSPAWEVDTVGSALGGPESWTVDRAGAVWLLDYVGTPQLVRVDASGGSLSRGVPNGLYALAASDDSGVVLVSSIVKSGGASTALEVARVVDISGPDPWQAVLAADPNAPAIVAQTGARVLVSVESSAGLVVGDTVVDGTPGRFLVTFDEATGTLLGHVAIEEAVLAAQGLPDGSFALALSGSGAQLVVVRDADLAPVWSLPVGAGSGPPVLTAGEDGSIFWVGVDGLYKISPGGDLTWKVPAPTLPESGLPLTVRSLAALPDGGALLGGLYLESARMESDGTVRYAHDPPAVAASWCLAQGLRVATAGAQPGFTVDEGNGGLRVGRLDLP